MAKIGKIPPKLEDDVNFTEWRSDIDIWLLFTDIDKKKHGPAIYLALEGKARDVVRDIDKAKLAADDGAKEIITMLEKAFLKDENMRA